MKNVYIDKDVKIGNNVTIEEFCYLCGNSIIKDNAKIGAFSKIINSEIGENTEIESSHIENSFVGENCKIGPMSKIKANSKIFDNCVIGNFVEIKNSKIGKSTKIKHLSYIGDAEIGKNVNVGAGVIFANYDGKNKHKIVIGNDVFIGCNSVLIAPLKIEDNCFIAGQTTLSKSLKQNSFAISRSELKIKNNKNTKEN